MQDSTCDECGNPYPQTTHNRRYCSRRCGRRADKRRAMDRLRARVLICEQCGDKYTGSTSPEPKYCSDECVADSKRRESPARNRYWTHIYKRDCAECGIRFIANQSTTKYCEGHRRSQSLSPFDCRVCETHCIPGDNVHHLATHYCSTQCRTRAMRNTPSSRKARARAKARRRAIKYGADADRFDPTEIHERDNWTCQICGKKTRPDWNYLHPLAPTIDHIIPLAKGGHHTRKNTQTACRRCNSDKNDGAANDQLRLIG